MKHLAVISLSLSALACQASAQESAYSHVNGETCHTVSESDEGGGYSVIQRCEGHDGWNVYFDSGDHGSSSAFSRSELTPETMPYGGYIGNFGGFNDVIEWRLDTRGEAFATIHRYRSQSFTSEGDAIDHSILIVTRLEAGAVPESCHVGYVVASEIADANVHAREMADMLAADFVCGDPIWIIDNANPDLANARRY